MKFKALRKIETKEFVELQKVNGVDMVFISELPKLMANTATMEAVKVYYAKECPTINLDDFELVEFDCIESGVVGADIRNKLTPLLNLIALCGLLLKDEHPEKKEVIKGLLKKEMETSKICIKYLVKLL